MKKIILFAFVLTSISVNAQFRLTIDGFVNSTDETKKYAVFEYDNIHKEELYSNVLKFITSNYRSAKDVVSKVDNEVITINAFQSNAVTCKGIKFDTSYSIVIEFKDNKIKINSPSFECNGIAWHGKPYRLTMSDSKEFFVPVFTVGLFKKNGKKSQEKTISQLEDFFNNLSGGIKIAGAGSNDDW